MKNYLILFSLLLTSLASFAQIADTPEEISPLLIGEKIPAIQVATINGEAKILTDVIAKKPTVLLFYRGGWCPYCNAHLAAVGELSEEIKNLNYQVIAVSPDAPEKLRESMEEQKLDYSLFSDADGELIKAMGLAFKSPDNYASMLEKFSAGSNPGLLPVPALFIIDTEGTIVFEYISPDYKNRIEAPLLLEVLKFYSKKLN